MDDDDKKFTPTVIDGGKSKSGSKRKRKLTAKQIGFANSIIDGMTQVDAYKANYDCSNSKDTTIRNESSRLMNNPDITMIVNQGLKKKKEQKELINLKSSLREEDRIISEIWDIVSDTKDKNPTASLKGLEMLGKRLGIWTERIEIDEQRDRTEIEQEIVSKLKAFGTTTDNS